MQETFRRGFRRALRDESGQVLMPWVAVLTLSFLGVSGLIMDVGRAYIAHSQLQNVANAAALAAAGEVYNSGTTNDAYAYAVKYSGSAGDNNVSGVGTVTTTVYEGCVNALMPSGSSCSSSSAKNAVQVTEATTVRNYIMPIFWGTKTTTVTATATASMQGFAQPWNVAIIVDSTGSMATSDSNCGGVSEFQCALSGVQTLLQGTNPNCPANTSNCPSDGYGFHAALFTFPNVLTYYNGTGANNGTATNSISNDINCNGSPATYSNYSSQPIAAPYTFPVPGATLPVDSTGRNYLSYTQTSTGKTWTATYQITPFLGNYYSPSSAGGLNSSSELVKAVGYSTTPGCLTYTFGIDGATGGGSGFGNTYFAGSIYSAIAALKYEKTLIPSAQSAIIFLSDGQANGSDYGKNSSAYGTANGTNQYAHAYEFPDAPSGSLVGPTTTSYPVPAYYTPATILATESSLGYDTLSSTTTGRNVGSGTSTGIYPDWNNQCQQAIQAAQYAVDSGGVDRVYSVAYGSESSGCSNGWSVGKTDTTLTATGRLQPFSSVSSLLPCTTMENIASSWAYFYSDNLQTGNVNLGCSDPNHPVVSLSNIFSAIAASFTTPRMLPNNSFRYGVQQTS